MPGSIQELLIQDARHGVTLARGYGGAERLALSERDGDVVTEGSGAGVRRRDGFHSFRAVVAMGLDELAEVGPRSRVRVVRSPTALKALVTTTSGRAVSGSLVPVSIRLRPS